MSSRKQHFWIALAAGGGASAALFYLSFALTSTLRSNPMRNALLYYLQTIGFTVCMELRGVHSATRADFAAVAIPVNAAIYTTLIYFFLRAFSSINSK